MSTGLAENPPSKSDGCGPEPGPAAETHGVRRSRSSPGLTETRLVNSCCIYLVPFLPRGVPRAGQGPLAAGSRPAPCSGSGLNDAALKSEGIKYFPLSRPAGLCRLQAVAPSAIKLLVISSTRVSRAMAWQGRSWLSRARLRARLLPPGARGPHMLGAGSRLVPVRTCLGLSLGLCWPSW